ncbi:MFS transporter, partial [Micromonospora sp. NPDC051296]
IIVAGVAVLTALKFSLPMVALFCVVAAMMSGIAKLAVDASIQERIPERLRASSFAHSETVLMLAFVAGGGLGLVPFDGRIGIGVAAGVGVLAAGRGLVMARRLRAERLRGRPLTDDELAAEERAADEQAAKERAARDREAAGTTDTAPTSPAPFHGGPDSEEPGLAPPGFHIYRPSSAVPGPGGSDDETRRSSPGPIP